jgi:hypothetical protein
VTLRFIGTAGIAAAAGLLCATLSSCASRGSSAPFDIHLGSLPSVAAVVNGHPIATSHVIDRAFESAGPQVLGELVDYQLLDQEAAREHIVVTPAELAARRSDMVVGLTRQPFNEQIKFNQTSPAVIDDRLLHQVLLEKLTAAQLPAPPLMLHVRHILIATAPTHRGVDINPPHSDTAALGIARRIQKQLAAGASFDALARKYSEDPYSRPMGGDLGVITKLSDPFDGVLWNGARGVGRGQLCPRILHSRLGYHLVQVVSWSTDPTPADRVAFTGVVEQTTSMMMPKLMTATMARLRDSAKVDVNIFH